MPDPETLRLILEHYRAGAAARRAEDVWWAGEGLSRAAICRRAGAALLPSRLIHDHQRRLGREVCASFAEVLASRTEELDGLKDFEALLEWSLNLTRTVAGAGALIAYDSADRLALHLSLPVRHIHLHAGTRKGAKVLGVAIARGQSWIKTGDLPAPLNSLSARDAENALCVYAKHFLKSPADFASWAQQHSLA